MNKVKPDWLKEKERLQKTPLEPVEFVGESGVDGVKDGKLPNGLPYEWRKRRP